MTNGVAAPYRAGRPCPAKPMPILAALTLLAAAPQTEAPRAVVWEIADGFTKQTGAFSALVDAGFAVRELDDDAPLAPQLEAADLLLLGSFVSESVNYGPYWREHTPALLEWLDGGGTVVQMCQADQTEAVPAFLPESLSARRDDLDVSPVLGLAAEHPLVRSIATQAAAREDQPPAVPRIAGHHRPGGWETFRSFDGMRVLLCADTYNARPVALEGAHGAGRVVLAALHFDKLEGRTEDGATVRQAPPAFVAMSRAWFSSLREYVSDVRAGTASPVVPSAPWVPPPPSPFVEGSFTLAVLPDTQVYAQSYPHHFEAQTRWIVENREALDIRYVLHLGDITNWNTPEQWEHAQRAMNVLDEAGVPYVMAPGNHDYGPKGNAATRETYLNEYFPLAAHASWPTFGGTHEPGKLDSSYHTFDVGQGASARRFLLLALEWGPRQSCVDWANEVVAKHPGREVILITHAYMFSDETRYDWATRGGEQTWNPHNYGTASLEGGVHDGQELWDELVSRHAGFSMTLNGHVLNDGQALLTSKGEHGNTVHQMLCNYQTWHEGGDGYLRLYEYRPDGTVQAKSYSPVLDRWLTAPDQQFVLEYPERRR